MIKKNKKGGFSDVMGVLIVVLILIITVYFIQLWMGYGKNEVQGILSNYEVTLLDRDIATATNVFGKTSLFFGLQKTAIQLGKHGGVPIDMDSTTIKDTIGLNPQFSNEIYKWSYVDENNNNHKRIPFTYYQTHNYLLGTTPLEIKIQNLNDAETTTNSLFVHIWMYKSGNVQLSCNGCTIKGTTKIEETGKYFLEISNTGTLKFTGSKNNVATIKTIAISPYSGLTQSEFVDSLNEQLTNNLQENTNLKNEIKSNDIYSIFETDQSSVFLNGFAISKYGTFGEITNPTLPKVTLQTSGETENLVNVRYWKIYNIVKDEIIKNDILYNTIDEYFEKTIKKTTDNIRYWKDGCGVQTLPTCETLLERYGKNEDGNAISDTSYFKNKMEPIIEQEIKKLETNLNSVHSSEGIIIDINYIISYPKKWNDYWNTTEIKNKNDDTGICCECNNYCPSCGSTSNKCTNTFKTSYIECEYNYGIRYTLQITITDTKYKITTNNPQNFTMNIVSEWINLDNLKENTFYADIKLSAKKCSIPKPTNGCYMQ
ncbi:hypothetical protein GQ473_05745, partial [archaeon]|nr:hypothetical protein [archaeon]